MRYIIALLLLTVTVHAGNIERYLTDSYISKYPKVLSAYYKSDPLIQWTAWTTEYYTHYNGNSCEIHYQPDDYSKMRDVKQALDLLYRSDIIGMNRYKFNSYQDPLSIIWNIVILTPGDPVRAAWFDTRTPLTIYLCRGIWTTRSSVKRIAGYILHESIHAFENIMDQTTTEYYPRQYERGFLGEVQY